MLIETYKDGILIESKQEPDVAADVVEPTMEEKIIAIELEIAKLKTDITNLNTKII